MTPSALEIRTRLAFHWDSGGDELRDVSCLCYDSEIDAVPRQLYSIVLFDVAARGDDD